MDELQNSFAPPPYRPSQATDERAQAVPKGAPAQNGGHGAPGTSDAAKQDDRQRKWRFEQPACRPESSREITGPTEGYGKSHGAKQAKPCILPSENGSHERVERQRHRRSDDSVLSNAWSNGCRKLHGADARTDLSEGIDRKSQLEREERELSEQHRDERRICGIEPTAGLIREKPLCDLTLFIAVVQAGAMPSPD